MKMFVVSLVILSAILGAGWISATVTDDICTKIIDDADTLYAAIRENYTGDALDIIDDMGTEWDKKEKVLAGLTDHKYLGDVRLCIDRIRQNLMFDKPELAAQNIAELKVHLTEIHDMGHIRLQNVF